MAVSIIITFHDHITNQAVKDKLAPILNNKDNLLTVVKKRKLKWYGHVSRGQGMATTNPSRNSTWRKETWTSET